jgi:hypothetical protein
VIRTLAYLRDRHPRRTALAPEPGCFRQRRRRMRYTAMEAQKLRIGSGVVEAALQDVGHAAHEALGHALASTQAVKPS